MITIEPYTERDNWIVAPNGGLALIYLSPMTPADPELKDELEDAGFMVKDEVPAYADVVVAFDDSMDKLARMPGCPEVVLIDRDGSRRRENADQLSAQTGRWTITDESRATWDIWDFLLFRLNHDLWLETQIV